MQGTARALVSSEQERAVAKLHAQAAQWEEYEDEYDDSFDDLAGFDADPNAETQSKARFDMLEDWMLSAKAQVPRDPSSIFHCWWW